MAQQVTRSNFPSLTKCKMCPVLISDVAQKSRARIYCSDACRQRARYIHKILDEKVCPHCKLDFQPKNNKAVFCSRRCYWKNKNKQVAKCEICGLGFNLILYGQRKYCSKKCGDAGRWASVIKKMGFIVEVRPI